jgi:hypothetical protein
MTGKGLPKRGIPPFCRRPKRASGPEGKGREEGFSLQCPYNYGLISINRSQGTQSHREIDLNS